MIVQDRMSKVMSESSSDLLKLANASGYFFQERLREEILLTHRQQEHKWLVETEEHRWTDRSTGSEGFIDLVLTCGDIRLVVECKRTKEATWVFLVSEPSEARERRAQGLWTTRYKEGRPPQSNWAEFQVAPPSPEASFCVVRGQGDRDQPILERLGGILLRSLEGLAEEELNIGEAPPYWDAQRRVYFPAIVTNAKLYACFYDPSEVDITTGELPQGRFEELGAIRFKKSMSTGIASSEKATSLAKANRQYQRTLFVVNATALTGFLKEFCVVGGPYT